jgi:hypothetical protein
MHGTLSLSLSLSQRHIKNIESADEIKVPHIAWWSPVWIHFLLCIKSVNQVGGALQHQAKMHIGYMPISLFLNE